MIDENSTDEQIVRKILCGNNEVFRTIVVRYQQQIFNIGLRFFKNEEDSYDFIQEVFIRAFQKLGTFKGLSPFRFWLFKIAYNMGVNNIKSYKNEGNIEDVALISGEKGPEGKHVETEIRGLLLESINKLPERYRICVDFYFFYDLSYGEISELTGYPVNTIKSHVFRAKKVLREFLSGTIAEEYYEM